MIFGRRNLLLLLPTDPLIDSLFIKTPDTADSDGRNFPFSKLMHMGGVFLSPTRNLANNNRAVRHINPWDYPVHVHTYEEYEDEFREKMVEVGIPVDKMPEPQGENKTGSEEEAAKE